VGRVTDESFVQLWKAEVPIVRIVVGRVTDEILAHDRNAELAILVTSEENSISHGDDEHLLQQPVPPLVVHTLLLDVQPPIGHTDRSALPPAPSQKYPVPQAAIEHDANDVPEPAATQVPYGHGVLIPPVQ